MWMDVKEGEWVTTIDEEALACFRDGWTCSVCGKRQTYGQTLYCPRCGAKMKKKNGEKAAEVTNGI